MLQDGPCNYLLHVMRIPETTFCYSSFRKHANFQQLSFSSLISFPLSGDHEYIDVIFSGNVGAVDRIIIDIDFRSHFEIARAVESYDALLNSLPAVYVGTLSRLKQFLQIMVDAAKYSLKLNSMPLPPWRSLAYLQAKWFSKHVRKETSFEREFGGPGENHRQCSDHLQKLKLSLQSEIGQERMLKPLTNDKKWRVKFERRRSSVIGYN